VNAIVPFEMAGRDSADVRIVHSGRTTEASIISIVEAQPGVFTTTGGTAGQGVVLNADGRLNSVSNPAAKGSLISIFATGVGQTKPPGVNGGFVADDSMKPLLRVEALTGGISGKVMSAHVPRGLFAGVVQVDVQLAADAPSGPAVPLQLAVGEKLSPPVATVSIK
jgi:uncharacterized protein (TIGR03437 family)